MLISLTSPLWVSTLIQAKSTLLSFQPSSHLVLLGHKKATTSLVTLLSALTTLLVESTAVCCLRQSLNNYSSSILHFVFWMAQKMAVALFRTFRYLNCNMLELIFSNHPFATGIPLLLPMTGSHSTPTWAPPVMEASCHPKKSFPTDSSAGCRE